MNSAFLDTGYLLALELANDQHHDVAAAHWAGVEQAPPRLVTTSLVFTEVVTFLNCRGFHARAVRVGTRLIDSPLVEIMHVDEPLFRDAWTYLCRHQDKRYSLADCASFLVMQQRQIDTAFTFDQHFSQAGFKTEP